MKNIRTNTALLVLFLSITFSFIIAKYLVFEQKTIVLKATPTAKKDLIINVDDSDEEFSIPSDIESPELQITNRDDKEKEVKLDQLSISTQVNGCLATTTMDMIFFNPNKRDLEAQLNFPLAENQTITRFAMDINGKLREGVAIEKEKARVAFETTVRKNIDPGLVEMTKGNNFKARVFPVPSQGYKHIIIQYTEELVTTANNSYYFLPLAFNDKLSSFSLKINSIEQTLSPAILSNNKNAIQFQKANRNFTASIYLKNTYANESIAIKLPYKKGKSRVAIASDETKSIFHANILAKRISKKKQFPNKITVFWDVSGSRAKANKKLELDFLSKYLHTLQSSEVELIPFANEIFSPILFNVKKGNSSRLMDEIKNLIYDGGTTISELPFDQCRGSEVLLFSDGLSNLGNPTPKIVKKRIYTILSSETANPSYLQKLALDSHGEYINLLIENEKEALYKIETDQLHFMGFENNSNLREYYPSKATPINGNIKLSGIIQKKKTTINALFGFGNKVEYKEKIHLIPENDNASSSKILEKIWAIKKIQELNQSFQSNKDQITFLGKKYKLVTQNTSLLVLDALEDYIQHEIVPPVEMQKEYYKRIASIKKEEKNEKKKHLASIYSQYKSQVEWWTKKHQPEEKKKMQAAAQCAPQDQEANIAFNEPVVQNENVDGLANSISSDQLTVSYSLSSTNATTYGWTANGTGTYSLTETEEQKGAISVKSWDPKSPYLSKIKTVSIDKAYSQYLSLKREYSSQPSFYLDVAEYFFAKGKSKQGLRILTNIAEMELENHSLLRILAHRLLQLKQHKLAIQLFKDLVNLRNEEPQSHRDLGLAYAEIGDYQSAIKKLNEVIETSYDGRFDGIHLICINEMNNIIHKSKKHLDKSFIDKRFLANMPVDIRVVLNWDADNTDVDLWVTDPKGEKCFYSNKNTKIGGRISNDFTQGYGPEEFMIKNAIPGEYKIEADYYGSSSQNIIGKATLQVQFFKQYGTPFEKKEEITRRLDAKKQVIELGTFKF